MEQECATITKVILPAVRVAIAQTMNNEYGWTQERIAKELGVVQVAVSKYLNKKYSKEVEKITENIKNKGIDKIIAKELLESKSPEEIATFIDSICFDIMSNMVK
ncbi:MAG: hypothetical protein QXD23_01100 [Candidatus Micrarchaeaceae archaeon]